MPDTRVTTRTARTACALAIGWLAGAALLASAPTSADDAPAAVHDVIEKLVPGAKPDLIAPAPVAGLYEVVFGPTVFYVSADGRYLFRGDLVDMKSRINLTRAREREARRQAMAEIDDGELVVFSPPEPKYTVTVFTDVDCVYCQRMHRQIEDYLRLGVRIRYAAFPRAGVGSSSYDRIVSVWCADDRLQAMSDAKAGRDVPRRECDNPVERQFDLGREMGVRGTPTLVLENGELIPGYMPPPELLELLRDGGAG